MKSEHAKKNTVERRWLLIDLQDIVLGRAASEVACILRGKRKPSYTPHVDTGDFVVVVNAEKVRLTGNKWQKKVYYDYSGFPGGLKERSAAEIRDTHPTDLFKRAVRGMLPKGPLGYQMITKLKIYSGAEHPHQAQNPEKFEMTEGRK